MRRPWPWIVWGLALIFGTPVAGLLWFAWFLVYGPPLSGHSP
jgi:hypothetical protein